MVGGWWCCCGCWTFTDDFDRADSTNLGAAWDEVSGNWEINSNHLYEPGNTGAIALGTGPVPVASAGEMSVACTFSDAATGMIFELYAASDATATTYFKSTHELLANGDWRTTIYKGGTSSATVDQTPTPYPDADHAGGWLCVDTEGNVKAGVVSTDAYAWDVALGGLTGRYYGVGHQNAVPTYFDNFTVRELRSGARLCNACWCSCCTTFVQKTLDITITGGTNDCASCLTGSTTVLTWEWDAGTQPWKGSGSWGGGPNTWTFRLECESSSDPDCTGQNWSLNVISECATYSAALCIGGGCTIAPNPMYSTCDPLSLVFGPFSLTQGMLGCQACGAPCTADGIYYLTITETP